MKNKLTFLIFWVLVPLSFSLKLAANRSPQAVAGDDQRVTPGASLTLDGSGSYDPDGDSLTYSWQETSTSGVQIDNPENVTITLTAPTTEEDYIFKLYVKDGKGGLDSDEVTVTVEEEDLTPGPSTTPESTVPGPEESGRNFDGGSEAGCSLHPISFLRNSGNRSADNGDNRFF